MIKSFKDFDIDSKNICESLDDNIQEENDDRVFTEDDMIVPELLSSNKFLLKISRIVLRKLSASGLGKFGVQPIIVHIDGVPGVYFYNYDDESMNIVICRNTNGKHVYLFKNFKMGGRNVADLVLSTTKLGFSNIIDEMIAYLSPSTIEEGLICEWRVSEYGGCSEKDVDSIIKIGATVRQLFANSLLKNAISKVATDIWSDYESGGKDGILICDEVSKAFSKSATAGLLRKICLIFSIALGTYTKISSADVVKDTKRVLAGLTLSSPSTSAIKSSSGISATVDDDTLKEIDAEYQAKLKEDTEEYLFSLHAIYKTAVAMCKYVKNDGEITANDRGWMETRALIITGNGGVGKSRNVKKALDDMKMIEGKDYYNVSSGSTAMASLYKKFYDYNGKLLLFDDSSGLFAAEYQKSFWKNALQSEVDNGINSPSVIKSPVTKVETKKSDTSGMYDPTKLTRQERYFREIGESTPEDRAKWEKQRRPEIREASSISLTEVEMKEILDQEWAELEDQRSPAMPTSFKYNGVVIIISNKTRKELRAEVGAGDWSAIVGRMVSYDLHPMAESIWSAIKENIERERDAPESEIRSEQCMVPRDMADEFIEEVEKLLKDPETCFITFRTVAINMHNILNSEETRPFWKRKLKSYMSIDQ